MTAGLETNKFILKPQVTMIAKNVIDFSALEEAIEHQELLDVAEAPGTPLHELVSAAAAGTAFGSELAEYAGRFCYRSWEKGRSTKDYIGNILREAHGSVLEHAHMTFQIVGVSRSLTHELIRHRVGTAYSQESQRYVDAKDVCFVVPPLIAWVQENYVSIPGSRVGEYVASKAMQFFMNSCARSLEEYVELQTTLKEELTGFSASDVKGQTALKKRINETARSLLPNAAETRLVFSLNGRTLRHIALLRGTEYADLEIRRLACAIVEAARPYAGHIIDDIEQETGSFGMDRLFSTLREAA